MHSPQIRWRPVGAHQTSTRVLPEPEHKVADFVGHGVTEQCRKADRKPLRDLPHTSLEHRGVSTPAALAGRRIADGAVVPLLDIDHAQDHFARRTAPVAAQGTLRACAVDPCRGDPAARQRCCRLVLRGLKDTGVDACGCVDPDHQFRGPQLDTQRGRDHAYNGEATGPVGGQHDSMLPSEQPSLNASRLTACSSLFVMASSRKLLQNKMMFVHVIGGGRAPGVRDAAPHRTSPPPRHRSARLPR